MPIHVEDIKGKIDSQQIFTLTKRDAPLVAEDLFDKVIRGDSLVLSAAQYSRHENVYRITGNVSLEDLGSGLKAEVEFMPDASGSISHITLKVECPGWKFQVAGVAADLSGWDMLGFVGCRAVISIASPSKDGSALVVWPELLFSYGESGTGAVSVSSFDSDATELRAQFVPPVSFKDISALAGLPFMVAGIKDVIIGCLPDAIWAGVSQISLAELAVSYSRKMVEQIGFTLQLASISGVVDLVPGLVRMNKPVMMVFSADTIAADSWLVDGSLGADCKLAGIFDIQATISYTNKKLCAEALLKGTESGLSSAVSAHVKSLTGQEASTLVFAYLKIADEIILEVALDTELKLFPNVKFDSLRLSLTGGKWPLEKICLTGVLGVGGENIQFHGEKGEKLWKMKCGGNLKVADLESAMKLGDLGFDLFEGVIEEFHEIVAVRDVASQATLLSCVGERFTVALASL